MTWWKNPLASVLSAACLFGVFFSALGIEAFEHGFEFAAI